MLISFMCLNILFYRCETLLPLPECRFFPIYSSVSEPEFLWFLLDYSEILEVTNDVIMLDLVWNWSGYGDERRNVWSVRCLTTSTSSSATDTTKSIKFSVQGLHSEIPCLPSQNTTQFTKLINPLYTGDINKMHGCCVVTVNKQINVS
jgi:hypothetical protein